MTKYRALLALGLLLTPALAAAQERTVRATFTAEVVAVQARLVKTENRSITGLGGVESVATYLDVRLPSESPPPYDDGLRLRMYCGSLLSLDPAEVAGACLAAEPGVWYEITIIIDGIRAGFEDEPTVFALIDLAETVPPIAETLTGTALLGE